VSFGAISFGDTGLPAGSLYAAWSKLLPFSILQRDKRSFRTFAKESRRKLEKLAIFALSPAPSLFGMSFALVFVRHCGNLHSRRALE
jgi:hypothetical protein